MRAMHQYGVITTHLQKLSELLKAALMRVSTCTCTCSSISVLRIDIQLTWRRYTKASTMAYVGTFYALAMSWPFTLLNCFLAAYSEGQRSFLSPLCSPTSLVFRPEQRLCGLPRMGSTAA